MRIAVPSDDESTVGFHFGRARGFLLFDVEGDAVVRAGYRRVAGQHPADAHGAHHGSVLEAIADCSAVIARGMGPHMRDDLLQRRIRISLTDVDDAAAAVALWTANLLADATEGCVKPEHRCCGGGS